jgi:AcrR family transcriptional regulator
MASIPPADAQSDPGPRASARPRIVKPAAERRRELLDLAERLFLERGYERTTVNDVIDAAGVSKGAFYHHFRAKEDLLEAIAERFAGESLKVVAEVRADKRLNALQRLNTILQRARAWKTERAPDLRLVFGAILTADNTVLYHRILGAMFEAVAPALAEIVAEGQRQGVFDPPDATLAAEVILSLAEGRQRITAKALALVDGGDTVAAARLIAPRLRAEEAVIDRVLGLAPGSVSLAGSTSELEALLARWRQGAV